MSELLNFELVSPEAKLVEEPVKMAVIPGEEGELGVGANHASFVVALKPGVVKLIKDESGDAHKIFITGGFADINAKGCSVLAEEAYNLRDLSVEGLQAEIDQIDYDLELAEEEYDKFRLNRAKEMAKLKLKSVKAA